MNKRLKLFAILTAFCITPLVALGIVTFTQLEELLLPILNSEVVEQVIGRLGQYVIIWTSAAIIAAYAAAFLVFAFFATQSGMLRNFINRFDDERSPIPEKVPEGEFSDVCLSFVKLAERAVSYKDELTTKTITDTLTGTLNKQEILKQMVGEISKAQRYKTPLSMLLLDIDKFQRINDNFGHNMADQILTRFASILSNSLRGHDIVGRYSGDVFLVVLPLTDLKYASNVADRIRAAVEVSFFGDPELQLTVSGAVTQVTDENADRILVELEEMLLFAKRKGRNCIEKAEISI